MVQNRHVRGATDYHWFIVGEDVIPKLPLCQLLFQNSKNKLVHCPENDSLPGILGLRLAVVTVINSFVVNGSISSTKGAKNKIKK